MPLSSVVGASSILKPGVCTSTTRPAAPYEGQTIYETDTDLLLTYNGSGWKPFADVTASTNGSVLQIVSTTKTDTFTSTTGSAWTDITGFSVSITPSSTSSLIFITVDMNVIPTRPTLINRGFRLVRGSTAIGVGAAAGSRLRGSMDASTASDESAINMGFSFLDSPATTSATTYKVQFYQTNTSYSFYMNRSGTDTDSASFSRTASTITVMEISG